MHLIEQGTVDPLALSALLDADEVAAQDAARLGQIEKDRAVTRIMGHADCLHGLSQTALGPRAADTLEQAAQQLVRIAALADPQ